MSRVDGATYREKLSALRDNFSVKVIIGFRGTGKTRLLKSFAEQLKSEGVSPEDITFMNFEELDFIKDFRQLYEYISEKIANSEKSYLLFDEIHRVEGWENAINALFLGSSAEIYLTGSSDRLMLPKLMSLLPDNCDVLHIYPLSFSEYNQVITGNRYRLKPEEVPEDKKISDYLKFGGLPIAASCPDDEKILRSILTGFAYEILFKDVTVKYSLRTPEVFREMARFLAVNVGNSVRMKDVDHYLSESGFQTTSFTLDNYLNLANESGLFKKIPRYDLKKETFVNGGERFYCFDTGICNALLDFNCFNETACIKNAVCIELERSGYDVYCARLGVMNIDFYALSGNHGIYIQVLPTDGTISPGQTMRPLNKLPNDVDKILISLNPVKVKKGVKNITAAEFLSSSYNL